MTTRTLEILIWKYATKSHWKKLAVHAELLPFTCSDCSLLLTAACTLGKMVLSLAKKRKYFYCRYLHFTVPHWKFPSPYSSKSCATHSHQCVEISVTLQQQELRYPFPSVCVEISVTLQQQELRYPFPSVCRNFSHLTAARAALPIPISV